MKIHLLRRSRDGGGISSRDRPEASRSHSRPSMGPDRRSALTDEEPRRTNHRDFANSRSKATSSQSTLHRDNAQSERRSKSSFQTARLPTARLATASVPTCGTLPLWRLVCPRRRPVIFVTLLAPSVWTSVFSRPARNRSASCMISQSVDLSSSGPSRLASEIGDSASGNLAVRSDCPKESTSLSSRLTTRWACLGGVLGVTS